MGVWGCDGGCVRACVREKEGGEACDYFVEKN